MFSLRILRCNKTSHLFFANYSKNTVLKFERKGIVPFHSQHNLKFSRSIHQGSIADDLRNDRNHLRSKNVSRQDHLEKWIAQLSADIHQKNRIYKNDFLKVLSKVAEHNFSSKRQGLLLINCCGYLLPDEAPSSRILLVDQVWNTLKPHTEFTVEHHNELLKIYTMNNHPINVNSFIHQMAPVKPNELTYKLILNAVCEVGDLNQAIEILSNLKAMGFALTESMFNSLIVGHGKERQIDKVKDVLLMMDTSKVTKTIDTYTAILRAYSYCGRPDLMKDVYKTAIKQGETFTEQHIMDIVKTLAVKKQYSHVPMALLYLPQATLSSPSISPYMQSVCTQLVHQNHPMVALEVYKCLPIPSFGPKDDQGLHGRSLIRDCVKASIPVNVITVIAQDLLKSSRNQLGLQSACEAALQLGKVPLALDLFTEMYQKNLPLRPHYFWPIFIETAKNSGEKGIINILSMMLDLNVQPDYETILNYILLYVSFSSPQNLMKKFTECGLTVSTMLTPMMVILLSSGQSRAASELCELYEGHLDGDKLMKPLVQGYISNGDTESIVYILKIMNEQNKKGQRDWIGRFLSELLGKMRNDPKMIKAAINEIEKVKLKIAPGVAESCLTQLEAIRANETIKGELKSAITSLIDDKIVDELEISTAYAHPRDMDEKALRAHLVELEAKGMNTRGVLRRLLQLYCRKGNLNAAKEMLEKCEQEGVNLSSGMKASIFDLHVKSGDLESAELALSDLQKTSPNFVLDEFKIIDFATLMVYRGKMDQAYDFINGISKGRRIKGGKNIEGNCWRLLDVIAANGASSQAEDMFTLLQQLGYCQPSNVILGPLIRVHLKSNDLVDAVTRYSQIAKKYRKTPLKHELLCKLLTKLKEQNEEESFSHTGSKSEGTTAFIQTILNANQNIHGLGDTQISLIAALADVGCKAPLRKMFLDPNVKIHHGALMKICEKFALEKKLDALELLAICSRGVRNIDSQEIYEAALNVHQLNDDYQSALSLWYRMQEADIIPSRKFIEQLASMLKLNKKNLPSDLVAYFGKNARSNIINTQ